MTAFFQTHETLFYIIGSASFFFFVGSLLSMPVLVGVLPEDYFARLPAYRRRRLVRHALLRPLYLFFKNVLGWILFLAGCAMLVLPGQGILTILVSLLFIDFPKRTEFILWIVRKPRIWRALQWLRKRRRKAPFRPPREKESVRQQTQ